MSTREEGDPQGSCPVQLTRIEPGLLGERVPGRLSQPVQHARRGLDQHHVAGRADPDAHLPAASQVARRRAGVLGGDQQRVVVPEERQRNQVRSVVPRRREPRVDVVLQPRAGVPDALVTGSWRVDAQLPCLGVGASRANAFMIASVSNVSWSSYRWPT